MLILCCIMAAIRVLFVFISDDFNSIEDYRIAQNIADGSGFVYVEQLGPTALKAPVYPYFLSVFILMFGDDAPFFIALFQHLVFSFLPLLIYRIMKDLQYGYAGIIAGFLFSLYPSFIYYPSVIETTSIFIPLILLWIYSFLKCKKTNSVFDFWLLGFISSLVFLTQPISLPFILAGIVYLSIKSTSKHWIGLITFFLILPATWSIRNCVEFNKFIPSKSPFWMNLYYGYSPDFTSYNTIDVFGEQTRKRIDSLRRITNDVEMEAVYKNEFFKIFSASPGTYFKKSLINVISYWWLTPANESNISLNLLLFRLLPLVLLHIMSIFGLFYLFKTNKTLFWIVILIFLYFTLVYSLTHPANTRFKLDIEWIQILISSMVICKWLFNKHPDFINIH